MNKKELRSVLHVPPRLHGGRLAFFVVLFDDATASFAEAADIVVPFRWLSLTPITAPALATANFASQVNTLAQYLYYLKVCLMTMGFAGAFYVTHAHGWRHLQAGSLRAP